MSRHLSTYFACACLIASASTVFGADKSEPGLIARSELPEPVVITSFQDEPTEFRARMVDGKVVAIDAVVPPMAANLEIHLVERSAKATTIEIKSSLPGRIKFDLHISPNDKTYHYSSTCPLNSGMSTFENWPYRIAWFALSNIRSVGEGESTCK